MAPSEPYADLRRARAVALRGIESALNRAVMLTERGRRAEGDLVGARDAMAGGRWQEAARGWLGARRHPLPAVRAAADLALGTILAEHLGQREHAKQALDRAWRSHRLAKAHIAAYELAGLHLADGDRVQAQHLYLWAWRHGEGKLRWRSAAALIRLLHDDGEAVAAQRLLGSLQRAAASATSSEGWETVASLLEERRDLDGAEAAYRAALDAGSADAASIHGRLGLLLSKQGRPAAALRELEMAVAGGAAARMWLQYELAKVQERLGNRDEACDAYADVLQGTDEALRTQQERGNVARRDPRPRAALRLGRLRESMGEIDAARDALAYAAEHGSRSVAAAAWLARARLERRIGDRSAARAGYANAIHIKGGAYPAAELGLAQLLIVAKQLGAARQFLDRLIDCGDPRIASLAAVQRGELLIALGDTAAARASYEAALAGPLSAGVRARVEEALSRFPSPSQGSAHSAVPPVRR
jgi:tetratricopeptide (TPR) repeat protein